MRAIRLHFTGWKAIALLLAVVSFPLLWRVMGRVGLDANVKVEIKNRLQLDLSSKAWNALGVTPGELPSHEAGAKFAATAQGLERLEIVEMEAKQGLLGARYLRAKFRVPGVEIPAGEDVRYYELGFNPLLGWTVKRGSSALFFNLGIWPAMFPSTNPKLCRRSGDRPRRPTRWTPLPRTATLPA